MNLILYWLELRQSPTTFDIFGRQMAKTIELCEVDSLSTCPKALCWKIRLWTEEMSCNTLFALALQIIPV